MLQGEHSAILSTFIKLPFAIKTLFCLCLSGRLRQVLLLWYIVEPVGYLDFVEGHGNQSDIMAVHFLIALSDK